MYCADKLPATWVPQPRTPHNPQNACQCSESGKTCPDTTRLEPSRLGAIQVIDRGACWLQACQGQAANRLDGVSRLHARIFVIDSTLLRPLVLSNKGHTVATCHMHMQRPTHIWGKGQSLRLSSTVRDFDRQDKTGAVGLFEHFSKHQKLFELGPIGTTPLAVMARRRFLLASWNRSAEQPSQSNPQNPELR